MHADLFRIRQRAFASMPMPPMGLDDDEERQETAGKVPIGSVLRQGDVVAYLFDFGDHLFHEIDVVDTDGEDDGGMYPRVVKTWGGYVPQYYREEDEGKEVAEPTLAKRNALMEMCCMMFDTKTVGSKTAAVPTEAASGGGGGGGGGTSARKCGHCRKEGHDRRSCPELRQLATTARQSLTKKASLSTSTRRCNNCMLPGHNRRSCPIPIGGPGSFLTKKGKPRKMWGLR